ncbi:MULTISPECIES: hypothetical protein [unclassified Helicobacter]|nr:MULTISPECIES: hypothetical protein [unclassified Helicobacter]
MQRHIKPAKAKTLQMLSPKAAYSVFSVPPSTLIQSYNTYDTNAK